MNHAFDQLASEVRQRRGQDTILQLSPRSSGAPAIPQELDAFAARCGLHAIGNGWREVGSTDALDLLTDRLARDPAHWAEWMPDAVAREYASRFVACLAEDARFFTNTSGPDVTSLAWTPLTDSTFDTGVLGIDADRIAILVVRDED